MSHRPLLLLAAAGLMLVSPAPVHAWRWEGAGFEQVALGSKLQLLIAPMKADFDRDGLAETLALDPSGHASILAGGRVRWQSPQAWQVRQALVADLNHDGQPEAVLLVWRPFRPWPVDAWLPSAGRINSFQDAEGLSCQIILIGWYQNAFRERWAGSALAEPVTQLAAADLNGDGRQQLITLESEYNAPAWEPARRLKVWDWNGFGFSLVFTLEGPFDRMQALRAPDGHTLLLVP